MKRGIKEVFWKTSLLLFVFVFLIPQVFLANCQLSKSPIWRHITGDGVRSVSISRGGDFIAASSGKEVCFLRKSGDIVWSYETGDLVPSVAISSDGLWVAAGSYDHGVYFFIATSGMEWKYETGGAVYSVDITPDGEYMAAGSEDGRIYLLNGRSRSLLWSYTTGDPVRDVSISIDAECIVAGSGNKVYFLDKSGDLVWNYEAEGLVSCVSLWSNRAAAGAEDGKVYCFYNRRYQGWELDGEHNLGSPVRSIWGNDAAGTEDGKVHYLDETPWSYTTGGPVQEVCVSRDRSHKVNWVAAGSEDGNIYTFDRNGNLLWAYGTKGSITSLSTTMRSKYWGYGGIYLAVGSENQRIFLFREPLVWYRDIREREVHSVAMSSDGSHVAVCTADGKYKDIVILFDKYRDWVQGWGLGGRGTSVSISSDGGYYAAGSTDEKIYLSRRTGSRWSWETGDVITSVAVSADGNYVAAASYEKGIYFITTQGDIGIPEPFVAWFSNKHRSAESVSISDDGTYVAAGTTDGKIVLYTSYYDPHDHIHYPQVLWYKHTDELLPVLSVSISSDGSYVAAGSWDNWIYLMRRQGPECLKWANETGGHVRSVSISSDGKYIAAGSEDGRVYLFDWNKKLVWNWETRGRVNSVSISSDGNYVAASVADAWDPIDIQDRVYFFCTACELPPHTPPRPDETPPATPTPPMAPLPLAISPPPQILVPVVFPTIFIPPYHQRHFPLDQVLGCFQSRRFQSLPGRLLLGVKTMISRGSTSPETSRPRKRNPVSATSEDQ